MTAFTTLVLPMVCASDGSCGGTTQSSSSGAWVVLVVAIALLVGIPVFLYRKRKAVVAVRRGEEVPLRRYDWTSLGCLAGGLALLVFGIYDHVHWVPRYNVCHSGLGAFGQALDSDAAHMCSTPNAIAPFATWAIVLGVLFVVGGIVSLAQRSNGVTLAGAVPSRSVRPASQSPLPRPGDMPEGWYADPSGVTRWWDGSQWTPNVRSPGTSPDS